MSWCCAIREVDDRWHRRPCGLMDKAPDFGSGDCRFESCHGRNIFLCFAEILIGLCSQEKRIMNYYILECIWFNTFQWKKKHVKRFFGPLAWWFSAFWDQFEVVDNLTKDLWYIREVDKRNACNPQIRSLVPYPFGHTAPCVLYTSILFYLCQNIICFVMICQTKTTKLSMKEKCCSVVSILQTGKVLI